jgi:transposase
MWITIRGLAQSQSRMRKEPVMKQCTTYVGLDIHKSSIAVAALFPDKKERTEWSLPNNTRAVERLARRLKRDAPGGILCCYEAGPSGYVLQRQLRRQGLECIVVAPSLIPVKPGERVKTDRRDARKLAQHLRSDSLTEVQPPTEAEESIRDLCRSREDAKRDQLRARHRLAKFLARRGLVYTGGHSWTLRHRRWLRAINFERTTDRQVFDDYMLAVDQQTERVSNLTKALEEASKEEPYREPVGWLRCFRGIDTITALGLLAEVHDFRRFRSARHLMSYLGLTPSEDSSGTHRRLGAITKCGNGHARRLLIEAAWHYRHRAAVSAPLRRRRSGQPPHVIALADKAQVRLNRRFYRLAYTKGRPAGKVVTAIARELSGFIWAVMQSAEPQALETEV